MRNRAVVSVAACLAVACGGGDSDPSGPFGAIAEVFGATPDEEVYVTFGSPAYIAPGYDPGGPAPYAPVPSALQVEGHLEGQLRDIRLSGDTTENYGSLETWPNGSGYLNASVALAAPGGAGMIILNVSGGMSHPVFSEGQWSSERELAFQSEPGWTGEQLISVAACAGPELGNYPYEQAAADYDMTVETDPADLSTVVVVVGASFVVNELSPETSEVSATVRFVRPE
jgi:hypothetical protein